MGIELFTGKPGAGKTNHAVQRAVEAIAKGRPVYVSNMNNMEIPGAIPFEDPRKWEELPAGSLLIVDEAQRFWRASRALDVPPEVQAMETHRHLGIDFLLTTQQATYLLKHLRGLVGMHLDHVRMSKSSCRVWAWANRCVEDTESPSERERAEESVYLFYKPAFKMYRSTEQDTHKPKIPRKLIFAVAAFAAVGGIFWWVQQKVGSLVDDPGANEKPGASAQPIRTAQGEPGPKSKLTPAEYRQRETPRDIARPWSAPMFDERKAVSKPEVYCMTSAAGTDAQGKWQPATHACITEQGTRVDMTRDVAADLAKRGGVYNPFRDPVRDRGGSASPGRTGDTGAGQRPAAMAATAAAPVGASAAFGDVASYGGIGIGSESAPR